MPRWQNTDRRDRLPPDWESKIRPKILRRDGRMCQWKFSDGTLCLDRANQVDHIKRGDDHRDSNLQSLCERHHAQKSSSEGGAARAVQRRKMAARFRRVEEHPGLI